MKNQFEINKPFNSNNTLNNTFNSYLRLGSTYLPLRNTFYLLETLGRLIGAGEGAFSTVRDINEKIKFERAVKRQAKINEDYRQKQNHRFKKNKFYSKRSLLEDSCEVEVVDVDYDERGPQAVIKFVIPRRLIFSIIDLLDLRKFQ
uniref:Uncharacterized protein n=1 Tax=Parietochloris pseudoalveolaris TaxID=3102 RepID=A0A097KLQ9_9CHLO|nr:hypothetical protein [Parietochloris pseudoalveolaris]AIT94117.1 hypothetical protein [Parietochloris pseudoalveolaris]